jgi:hypothetical protein
MTFMNSYYTEESLTMIAKCWNCHTEFEVVSSAADTNKHTAPAIAELLLHNMFDGDSGGLVTMSVDILVKEVSELVAEYLEEK